MTDRQAFGVLVRALGVVAGLYGLTQWLVVIARLASPNPDPGSIPHRFPIFEDILFGVFWTVLGLILLMRSRWLVRFAYTRVPARSPIDQAIPRPTMLAWFGPVPQ